MSDLPRALAPAALAVVLACAATAQGKTMRCPVGHCAIEVDEALWTAEERRVGEGATLLLRPTEPSDTEVFLTLRPRVAAEQTPRQAFERDSRTVRVIYGALVVAEQDDVVLSGATAHRIDFSAGGRRFLRYTLFAGPYTLLFGLSAPSKSFDAGRTLFQPIEASFELTPPAESPAARIAAPPTTTAGQATLRPVLEAVPVLHLDGADHMVAEVDIAAGEAGAALRGVRIALRAPAGRTLAYHWLEGAELSARLRVFEPDGREVPFVTALPARGRALLFLPRLRLPPGFTGRGRVEVEILHGSGRGRSLNATLRPMPAPKSLRLRFPLKGVWRAVRGPADGDLLRRSALLDRRGIFLASRFGLDLVAVDSRGERPRGAKRNEDFPAFGAPVHAPASGEVIEAANDRPDNPPGSAGQDPAEGNHVRLRHADGAVTLLAHLRQGSVRLKAGDRVQVGDVVGAVGNSGRSREPHLRFEVCDGERPRCQGLPVVFEVLELPDLKGWREVKGSAVDAGWVFRSK